MYLIGTGSTAHWLIFPNSSLIISEPVEEDNIYETDSFEREKGGVQ